MAFTNEQGQLISYSCTDLIQELKEDIAEFGESLIVDVVTEVIQGVTIYKDYNFIDCDSSTDFKLEPEENIRRMSAVALLVVYEQQNSIL